MKLSASRDSRRKDIPEDILVFLHDPLPLGFLPGLEITAHAREEIESRDLGTRVSRTNRPGQGGYARVSRNFNVFSLFPVLQPGFVQ